MQARKLHADMKQLQEHNQEVDGRAASLESELSDIKNKLKAEKEQAQQAHQTLVTQQEARTPSLLDVLFTHVYAYA